MELSQLEQAQLIAFVNTDGFKILCMMMKDEVLKFNAELLAAKKPEDVIIAHNQASAATKFYESLLNRIESETYVYSGRPKKDDKPIDPTEGMLDFQNSGLTLEEEEWMHK